MCFRGGRFCAREAMRIAHEIGYKLRKSVRDESHKFHLWEVTDDTGKVLYFDFNRTLTQFLQEKSLNA